MPSTKQVTNGDIWMQAMRRGDHQAAWAIADEILRARDPATRDDPTLPYHRRWVWDGTPLRGQDILVRCYHGLGDTLQFARFLPALRAQASRVTLEVQPELASLLATIAGPDRIVPFSPGAPTPPSPCDIEIMELAQALRLPPDAAPVPYLHAPPIPAPPGAIGLCWQAGNWDEARSIPTHALAPIIATCRPLYSLHPSPSPPGFLNPGGCPADIAQTARLLSGLDLIVTVDSMIAHLAGALGRPTWLLLRRDADWRWMDATARSPWYPSMRVFRQAEPGEWGMVIAEISDALGKGRDALLF